jgi:hypothetical protein
MAESLLSSNPEERRKSEEIIHGNHRTRPSDYKCRASKEQHHDAGGRIANMGVHGRAVEKLGDRDISITMRLDTVTTPMLL